MRRVSAIKEKLWLDHRKDGTLPFHIYPSTSVTSHDPQSLLLLHMQRTAHSSAGSMCIVYSPLFVVMVHWGTSNKWTGIWQGLWDVGGGEDGGSLVCWESPISSGGRALWSAGPRCVFPAPSSVSVSLCFPTAPARLHAWQTDRCYLLCISSSGPLSLSTNSPLLAHRLQISLASLPLDKGQYQWQNIFYVWNVAHNKQSSIRFV